jgi:hypothetical protein
MKDAQVERKHRENERGKGYPPEGQRCHGAKANDAGITVQANIFIGSRFTKIIRVRLPRAWEN